MEVTGQLIDPSSYAQKIANLYSKLLAQGDPRVENWPLMSSPLPSFSIVLAYLLIVVWWGQDVMMRRSKPFNLRPLMLGYNFLMVLFSAWLCFEFGAAGWLGGGYSLGCQPVDRSNRQQALRMARVCWWFFISKFVELFDTVCFVLRGKFEQVSFLHVFHHAIMPASWWFGVKYVPGGLGTFHALLNSFIHFLMYTYYGLAAAGPRFRRFLWWKRYLTKAQILQFIVVIAHSSQLLFQPECDYPTLFVWWVLTYSAIFLMLFINFYVKAYKQRRLEANKDALAKSAKGLKNE